MGLEPNAVIFEEDRQYVCEGVLVDAFVNQANPDIGAMLLFFQTPATWLEFRVIVIDK
jgi:hypothetical protein